MSEKCELSTYGELADVLAAAPMLLRERRRERRLSLRTAAAELSCSASTVARFEAGEGGVATDTLIQVIRWLGAEDGPTDTTATRRCAP